jgi:hypothetical protein
VALLLRAIAILGLLLLSTAPAAAVCRIKGFASTGSATPSTWNLGTYSGANPPPPITITLTVTYTHVGGPGTCRAGIGFAAPFGTNVQTATMQLAGNPSIRPLPFTVTVGGANALTVSATSNPTVSVPLPPVVVSNSSGTITATVVVTITGLTPTSLPSAGAYTAGLVVNLFDLPTSTTVPVGGSNSLTLNATVTSGCSLLQSTGSLSLDFTADIVGGKATGTVTQNTSFNVSCNAASKIQISGSAMTRSPVGTPSAGFDILINHKTVAIFAGVSATLITNGTTPVIATSPTKSTAFGANQLVTLSTKLVPTANPLAAGIYRGVVHVKIDPTL